MRRVEATRGGMLPVTKHDQMVLEGLASPEVEHSRQQTMMPYAHASGVTRPQFQPVTRGNPNPAYAAPPRGNPPYPSPPASEDSSPPKETNPLPPPPRTPTKPRSTSVTSRGSRGLAAGSRPKSLFHRRSTLSSGSAPGLLPNAIASIQIPPSSLPDVLIEEGPTPRTSALPPVTPRVGNASGLPATPIPATPRVGVAAR